MMRLATFWERWVAGALWLVAGLLFAGGGLACLLWAAAVDTPGLYAVGGLLVALSIAFLAFSICTAP